ncbi:hypothetical protein LAZ67_4003506 [Cordylochernes scorpioides]|uniref:Integrase catalytic domain-containing protein n=1 Tax=Cordylochernes scorpioides TaxID=51811 RepID=A0ABY6KDQ6_9ARAC|nr:hypothetical protein LAZ67_4003506 [Cordylochernes scorpioides]
MWRRLKEVIKTLQQLQDLNAFLEVRKLRLFKVLIKAVSLIQVLASDTASGNQQNKDITLPPSTNGLVERFHRQLKDSLRCHDSTSWSLKLPLVLLGIRSSLREDLNTTTAELVYGKPLSLPGTFFEDPPSASSPTEPWMEDFKRAMASLKPAPSKPHGNRHVYVPKPLETCSHVYLRRDLILPPLAPPYDGPYEVLFRKPKIYKLKIKKRSTTNGLVERFHRQLKDSLHCHDSTSWSLKLPLVLLGIRSSLREDLNTTTAELVYGKPLPLPGTFFEDPPSASSPTEPWMEDFKRAMASLKPAPSKPHGNRHVYVPKPLETCSHVYLRRDLILPPLAPPYDGPYEVLFRKPKIYKLKIKKRSTKTSQMAQPTGSIDLYFRDEKVIGFGFHSGEAIIDIPEEYQSPEHHERTFKYGKKPMAFYLKNNSNRFVGVPTGLIQWYADGEFDKLKLIKQDMQDEETDLADEDKELSDSTIESLIRTMADQQRLMTDFLLKNKSDITVGRPVKMDVATFDGRNADPKIWIKVYENICGNNGWVGDEARINRMRSYLTGSALLWFDNKFQDEEEYCWKDWKQEFICSFNENPIVPSILNLYHDDPKSGGHSGFWRTYYTIKNRFWWRNMKGDIRRYVQSCSEELKKKSESNASTQSFLVVIDEATRIVYAKCMKQSGKALKEYFTDHPILKNVKKIISDRGTSFTRGEFYNWTQEKGIRFLHTSPYHPAGNGLAERVIQEIKTFMECYPQFPKGWKCCLEAAVNYHNRHHNTYLGCSPWYKWKGTVPIVPADEELGLELLRIETENNDKQRHKYRLRTKYYYNRNRRRPTDIKPGDSILVKHQYTERSATLFFSSAVFRLRRVQNKDGVPNSVLAESPRRAARMPERPSSKIQASPEILAKIDFQNEISNEIQELAKYANLPAGEGDANFAAVDGMVIKPSSSGAEKAAKNWAETIEEEDDNEDGYTVMKQKKRRRDSVTANNSMAQFNSTRTSVTTGATPRRRTPGKWSPARQASSTQKQCVYIEHCPNFTPYQSLQAVDKVIGGAKNIIQLTSMNGHVLVGLTTKALAERLIDGGFEIEGTTLRTFYFRKRSERIIIENLTFFVEDVIIIDVMRPYGRVTSTAPMQFKMGEYTYTDGHREAYIFLHDDVKLERLPTRLEIKTKDDTLPAFLFFGIKYSKCNKQGHRRVNCSMFAKQTISPTQASSSTDVKSSMASQQPSQPAAALYAPTPPTPPMEVPSNGPKA